MTGDEARVPSGQDCGCGGADHDECALANSFSVTVYDGEADEDGAK